jgi:hypothetical protein
MISGALPELIGITDATLATSFFTSGTGLGAILLICLLVTGVCWLHLLKSLPVRVEN